MTDRALRDRLEALQGRVRDLKQRGVAAEVADTLRDYEGVIADLEQAKAEAARRRDSLEAERLDAHARLYTTESALESDRTLFEGVPHSRRGAWVMYGAMATLGLTWLISQPLPLEGRGWAGLLPIAAGVLLEARAQWRAGRNGL